MDDHEQSGPSDPTRRDFLRAVSGTAAAAVITGCAPVRPAGPGGSPAAIADAPDIQGAVPITLRINGKDYPLRIDPRTTLLDCIRETVLKPGDLITHVTLPAPVTGSKQHDYVFHQAIRDDYHEDCGEATAFLFSVPNLRVAFGRARRSTCNSWNSPTRSSMSLAHAGLARSAWLASPPPLRLRSTTQQACAFGSYRLESSIC